MARRHMSVRVANWSIIHCLMFYCCSFPGKTSPKLFIFIAAAAVSGSNINHRRLFFLIILIRIDSKWLLIGYWWIGGDWGILQESFKGLVRPQSLFIRPKKASIWLLAIALHKLECSSLLSRQELLLRHCRNMIELFWSITHCLMFYCWSFPRKNSPKLLIFYHAAVEGSVRIQQQPQRLVCWLYWFEMIIDWWLVEWWGLGKPSRSLQRLCKASKKLEKALKRLQKSLFK